MYAYEHELDEVDEWEAAHALDIEAAEEEMHAMRFFEPCRAGESQQEKSAGAAVDCQPLDRNPEADSAGDGLVIPPQRRLDQLLARCETLLGEDKGDQDVVRASRLVEDMEVCTKRATSASSENTATAAYLHSRPPMDVDSLSVVLGDGKRLFLRKKRPRTETAASSSSVRTTTASLVPIREMMEAVERVCYAWDHLLLG